MLNFFIQIPPVFIVSIEINDGNPFYPSKIYLLHLGKSTGLYYIGTLGCLF